ncbi:MAG: TlpA family protein disulfide reductase [Bosea sp.]|uniref:TlpA family protein disulfide reductase n=1 Tax=Bosea sp. (in: a-proteobacteria) TaxID=1871050 RepID=UPI001D2DE5F6|nr:TlpA family protein disulfide reductase [Beijerinckiaceae bacterium]MCP4560180.1 TlpA family protein disulfide reductase [Bosea sp. (in: a-proteobacteria)]MCP4734795.1 TlpA family protein disulfide reductase [Bosea sp. (in: a-proteobacteria)]
MATLAVAVAYVMVTDRTLRPRSADALAFQRLDGSATDLASFRGQAVLLTVWATWCWSCREEMPALARLHRGLDGRPPAVLALSVDRDGAEVVEPLLTQLNVKDLPVYLDPTGASVGRLSVSGLPTTILFGPDGSERGRWFGVRAWDEKPMIDEIAALLAGAPQRSAR